MQNIQIKMSGLCWRPPPAHAPLSQSWFSGRPALKVARPRSSSRALSSLDREQLGSSESAVVSPTGSALRLTDGRSAGEEHLLAAEGRLRKIILILEAKGFFQIQNTYLDVQINTT